MEAGLPLESLWLIAAALVLAIVWHAFGFALILRLAGLPVGPAFRFAMPCAFVAATLVGATLFDGATGTVAVLVLSFVVLVPFLTMFVVGYRFHRHVIDNRETRQAFPEWIYNDARVFVVTSMPILGPLFAVPSSLFLWAGRKRYGIR